MTREEQIREASIEYQLSTNPRAIGGDAFADFAREMNVNQSFIAGAKWADSRPRKGLVDVEKVEQWIKDCFAFINDAGHHNFKVDKFIENFKQAMKE